MNICIALEKVNLLMGVDRCHDFGHRHGHSHVLAKETPTILRR